METLRQEATSHATGEQQQPPTPKGRTGLKRLKVRSGSHVRVQEMVAERLLAALPATGRRTLPAAFAASCCLHTGDLLPGTVCPVAAARGLASASRPDEDWSLRVSLVNHRDGSEWQLVHGMPTRSSIASVWSKRPLSLAADSLSFWPAP